MGLRSGSTAAVREKREPSDTPCCPCLGPPDVALHIVAFARTDRQRRAAVIVAPRLALKILYGRMDLAISIAIWGETSVRLPIHLRNIKFFDAQTNVLVETGPEIAVSSIFQKIPLALLISDQRPAA